MGNKSKWERWLPITIMIVIAAILLFSIKDNNKFINVERTKFTNVNYDGSFVIKVKDGKITTSPEFTPDKKARQYEWYSDPLCGDCIRAHKATNEYVEKAVKNGEMEIKYHPLNYLSQYTDNDYSLKASAWVVAIADKSPENIYKFMDLLYNEKYRDNYMTDKKVEKAFMELAKKAGVSNSNAEYILRNLEKYENSVNRASVNIRRFDKWKAMSPKEDKTFFVPFIFNVNDKKALLGESENAKDEILKPLQGVSCSGICE